MKFSVFTVGTPDLTIPQVVQRLKHHGYDAVGVCPTALRENPIPCLPELWYWGYNQTPDQCDDEEAKMAKLE